MEDSHHNRFKRYLTLSVGTEFFAMDIFLVREILDMTEITRIPQSSSHMRGVVNVRGNAVPVIDLGLKFGMGEVQRTLNTRIVIAEIHGEEGLTVMGALADSVKEVLEIDANEIDPLPAMGGVATENYIQGIAKHDGRFILVLDVDKVFASDASLDIRGMVEDMLEPAPTMKDPLQVSS